MSRRRMGQEVEAEDLQPGDELVEDGEPEEHDHDATTATDAPRWPVAWDEDRCAPIRLGGRRVLPLAPGDDDGEADTGAPEPSQSFLPQDIGSLTRQDVSEVLQAAGFHPSEITVILVMHLDGVTRRDLPEYLGWPLDRVRRVYQSAWRRAKALRAGFTTPEISSVTLRRDWSRTARFVRFAGGGETWEPCPDVVRKWAPGSKSPKVSKSVATSRYSEPTL